jgi:hypothetical protein
MYMVGTQARRGGVIFRIDNSILCAATMAQIHS